MMLVEEIIKTLCIQTPIIIQDMCILLYDHRSLCMAGVTLNGFNITAVQFEFVCNTGVSEAMKDHFGEIVFLNQPLQYSFSFLPRVANLDFSSLSVYVTVGCSHSPPYYLKQQKCCDL